MRTLSPLAPFLLLAGIGLAASSAACGDDPAALRSTPADPSDDGGDGGIPKEVVATSTPMRRLTKAEYASTASDLFPGITLSFDAIVDDQRERNQFENDVSSQGASELVVASFAAAAEQIATKVVASDKQVAACAANAVGQDACINTWFDALLPRVYRRPVTGDEEARLVGFYAKSKAGNDFGTAVKMAIAGLLLTPQFLYRLEMVRPGEDANGTVPLAPHEVASRLSYFLWGSMPDDALFAAAAANALGTPEQIEAQARRMLALPRARESVRRFHTEWLDLDKTASILKDPVLYPQVDGTMRESMREESTRFAEWATFDGPGTLEGLLTSPQSWVDPKLAALYGVPAPAAGTWALTNLDPKQRAGILTHASIQAVHSHDQIGSPILRGVFVMERLLCQPLSAPADVPPEPSRPTDGTPATQTERQAFDALTIAPACWGCHQQINPLGHGFGHYDAIGKWRNDDHGLPLDVTGTLDDATPYDGAIELSKALAKSEVVRSCFARQWYRFAMGRQEGPDDAAAVGAASAGFAASGYKLQELLVSIARSPAFLTRRGDAP